MTEFLLWYFGQDLLDMALQYGCMAMLSGLSLSMFTDFEDEGCVLGGLLWPLVWFIVAVVTTVFVVFKGLPFVVRNIIKYAAFPFHWIMIRYYKWKYHA